MRRRMILCPLCAWGRTIPIRNALGDAAYLRGELSRHLRERHPVDAPADATNR